jgi:hypothetical protein
VVVRAWIQFALLDLRIYGVRFIKPRARNLGSVAAYVRDMQFIDFKATILKHADRLSTRERFANAHSATDDNQNFSFGATASITAACLDVPVNDSIDFRHHVCWVTTHSPSSFRLIAISAC